MGLLFILGAGAALLYAPPEEQPLGQCLGGMLFFETGSARLRPSDAALLNGLRNYPIRPFDLTNQVRFIIYAGTDPRGSEAYNLALSRRRGEAVRGHLMRMGLPRDRIRIIAQGEHSRFPSSGPADAHRREAIVMIDAPAETWTRYMPGIIC